MLSELSKEPWQHPHWGACSRYWQIEEGAFDRETAQDKEKMSKVVHNSMGWWERTESGRVPRRKLIAECKNSLAAHLPTKFFQESCDEGEAQSKKEITRITIALRCGSLWKLNPKITQTATQNLQCSNTDKIRKVAERQEVGGQANRK